MERKLSSRDRLRETLNHRQPDRLCVDFGAGGQTGMGVLAVHRLRQEILPDPGFSVKVIEPYQMLGEVDIEMIQKLHLDVAGIHGPGTMLGFKLEEWKSFRMHDGTAVQVPGNFNYTVDKDGAVLIHPGGDLSARPTAKMPVDSYFFDAIPRDTGRLNEAELEPANNCEEFTLLSEEEIKTVEERVNYLYESTDLGIFYTLPGAGFGDIAMVPAPWLEKPAGIRDIQEWYLAQLMYPDYIKAVFEKQCEVALRNIELIAPVIKEKADVVFISGTDFGTQTGLFNSLESYRDLFKPFHIELNRKVHELTGCKTFIHTCGAVYDLIPDLIEAGFDILNPVQISATGMDPARLKKEFGKDVVFWGGGIDTQHTLAFGSPDEVYREVRSNSEVLSDGGGFVFNSVHNIQSNVPTENLVALFRALDDIRGL